MRLFYLNIIQTIYFTENKHEADSVFHLTFKMFLIVNLIASFNSNDIESLSLHSIINTFIHQIYLDH